MLAARRQPGGYDLTQGRPGLCRWCKAPIVYHSTGEWVHTSRAFSCRNPLGGWASTTAEPARGIGVAAAPNDREPGPIKPVTLPLLPRAAIVVDGT
jgi:hypothetical protein